MVTRERRRHGRKPLCSTGSICGRFVAQIVVQQCNLSNNDDDDGLIEYDVQLSWHSTTPTRTRTPTPIPSRGSSRECRRVVQLAIGITSGNRACRTCRRGSSRGCPCRCRRRGIPALRVVQRIQQYYHPYRGVYRHPNLVYLS